MQSKQQPDCFYHCLVIVYTENTAVTHVYIENTPVTSHHNWEHYIELIGRCPSPMISLKVRYNICSSTAWHQSTSKSSKSQLETKHNNLSINEI